MILLSNLNYMWSSVILPRIGDVYVFGGTLVPGSPQLGTDCSGAVSAANEGLLYGPAMTWARQFSTMTFAGANPGETGPFGGIEATSQWVCVASPADIPAGAVMKVAVLQLQDPSDAHMVCSVLDPANLTGYNPTFDPNVYVGIESGGSFTDANGNSTLHVGPIATPITDPEFDQWFYLPGPLQSAGGGTDLGLDYSGGTISAMDILSGGYTFVCRYLFDGAPELPEKLLTPAEADQLRAGNVEIVGVYEGAANGMLGGAAQGTGDAREALANGIAAGMAPGAPIYFACDWNAQPTDMAAIEAYLEAAAVVLGGPQYVGIYGGYAAVKAALDAGVCQYGWQTEAWSNGQIDPRANIIQNSETIGEVTIDRVQCDVDTSVTAYFGQWNPSGEEMTPEQAAQLAQVWGALFNQISSQSPFRSLGEGAILQQHQMPINDDGFLHPQYVEWAATAGDPISLAVLNEVANGNPSQYPDRVEDIKLAQTILGRVTQAAGGSVPPAAAPSVDPAVDPAAPNPEPPGTVTINTTKLTQWLKDAVTIIGAIATWATAAHDVLGQYLTPAASVALPGAIALVTTAFGAHTVHQRRVAVAASKGK